MATSPASGLRIVPHGQATALLAVMGRLVAINFVTLLTGPRGMHAFDVIRVVASGATDGDAALGWTSQEMLTSLRGAGERQNAAHPCDDKQECEVRDCILPLRYTPAFYQNSRAALVLANIKFPSLNGDIACHQIGFGRYGYIKLTVVAGSERIGCTIHMENGCLAGLTFCPRKTEADITPSNCRAPADFASASGFCQCYGSVSAKQRAN